MVSVWVRVWGLLLLTLFLGCPRFHQLVQHIVIAVMQRGPVRAWAKGFSGQMTLDEGQAHVGVPVTDHRQPTRARQFRPFMGLMACKHGRPKAGAVSLPIRAGFGKTSGLTKVEPWYVLGTLVQPPGATGTGLCQQAPRPNAGVDVAA